MRILTLLATGLVATSALAAQPSAMTPPPPPPPEHVVTEKEMVKDDDYEVRLSLPTESDVQAWKQPGLRVALAFGYGHIWASGPAQALNVYALTIRVLARLDEYWSAGLNLQYSVANGKPMSGLQFDATAQIALHPWRQLGVSIGLGYAGLILSPSTGTGPVPGDGAEVSDVTFGGNTKFGSCTGAGVIGLARVEYLFVVGPIFSTGPYVEVDAQYTQCEQQIGPTNEVTGNPIQAKEWWLNEGAVAGWWVTWR